MGWGWPPGGTHNGQPPCGAGVTGQDVRAQSASPRDRCPDRPIASLWRVALASGVRGGCLKRKTPPLTGERGGVLFVAHMGVRHGNMNIWANYWACNSRLAVVNLFLVRHSVACGGDQVACCVRPCVSKYWRSASMTTTL